MLLHFTRLLLGLMLSNHSSNLGLQGLGQNQGLNQGQAAPIEAGVDKNQVLEILQRHPPTNDGMKAALPELQKAFPGVKILDHPQRLDKLQFPNGAVVDVVVGAGGTNPSWGWMPEGPSR